MAGEDHGMFSFSSLNREALIFVVLGVATLSCAARETQRNDFQGILPVVGVYINSASKSENALICPTT